MWRRLMVMVVSVTALLVPLIVLLALLIGLVGFRSGAFDPVNLVGVGLAAAVGIGVVIYCADAPWLVG